jgi:hypothetical protein
MHSLYRSDPLATAKAAFSPSQSQINTSAGRRSLTKSRHTTSFFGGPISHHSSPCRVSSSPRSPTQVKNVATLESNGLERLPVLAQMPSIACRNEAFSPLLAAWSRSASLAKVTVNAGKPYLYSIANSGAGTKPTKLL